jgi:DNA-binding SARP family transcriptional activator
VIRARVLGPVDVSGDGGPLPPELLWRKHLALLLYLALSPRRTRERDHLIGLLWGDKSESAGRHSLREAVRILRQAMGAPAVETMGQQIRLAAGAVALDSEEFDRLAGLERWDAAGALMTGDFLEGFSVPDASAFEDWLSAMRDEWRRRAGDAFRAAAARHLDAGRTGDALAAARRALALQPLSDGAVQQVMRASALHGDRAAALETYREFVERARRDAGGTPAAATTELAERVARTRGPAPPTPGPPPNQPWTRRAPLVGREPALARLLALWDRVAPGRGAAVALVEGDLGHGRTRLLDELASRVTLAGGAVARVAAVRADRTEPWSGVLGLARGGLADAPGVSGARREAIATFVRAIPAWADAFPAARQVDGLPPGVAFREVAAAAAAQGPLLLAADDAQWLDDDSLLALQAAMRDLARAPVLLVLSTLPDARRDPLDELRAALGQQWEGAVITVGPLAPEEIAALAGWALPRYGADALERVTRRVARDSAGIPLLVVELLHAIALGLEPEQADGAWPAPLRTLSQTLPADLPEAVVGAVRIGFRAMSANAQTVLAALSVLPDRTAEQRLAGVTALRPADLHAALGELEWQRWITAEARGYAFVAQIVKDIVARDMLTPGQKRRLQEAAGLTPA